MNPRIILCQSPPLQKCSSRDQTACLVDHSYIDTLSAGRDKSPHLNNNIKERLTLPRVVHNEDTLYIFEGGKSLNNNQQSYKEGNDIVYQSQCTFSLLRNIKTGNSNCVIGQDPNTRVPGSNLETPLCQSSIFPLLTHYKYRSSPINTLSLISFAAPQSLSLPVICLLAWLRK